MRKRVLSRFSPFGVAAVLLSCVVAKSQNGAITHQIAAAPPGRFVDVTAAGGIHFQGQRPGSTWTTMGGSTWSCSGI
jgi:hypothetical protein